MTTRSKDWFIVIGLVGLALIPVVGGVARANPLELELGPYCEPELL